MARILLVDDEETVRAFVCRALGLGGHQVSEARNGAEALQKLAAQPFDLVLTDIAMPVMDGIALALKAAKDYPELRILMMTGFDAEKARAHNLHFLVHDVLSKPFTLDQLTQTVARVLAAPPATDPT